MYETKVNAVEKRMEYPGMCYLHFTIQRLRVTFTFWEVLSPCNMFACVKKFSGLLMSVTECFSFIYTVRLIFDLSGKVMQEGAIGWEPAFCTNCVQDRVTFLSLSIYIAIGIFSLGSGDGTIYTYIYISVA